MMNEEPITKKAMELSPKEVGQWAARKIREHGNDAVGGLDEAELSVVEVESQEQRRAEEAGHVVWEGKNRLRGDDQTEQRDEAGKPRMRAIHRQKGT